MSSISYTADKDESNMPKLLQGEEVYLWQDGVTFSEQRGKFSKGILQLTTYHMFWYSPSDPTQDSLKVPLFYVRDFKTSKGWFTNPKMKIYLTNTSQNPPYAKHLYEEMLKMEVPPLPYYPEKIKLEFTAGGVEKVSSKLTEALAARHWLQIGSRKEEIKFITQSHHGVAGIKKSIQTQSKQMSSTISSSFTDMNSLKESAKKLVLCMLDP
eukprot:TRINITY_DN14552_c0_g1_i6.p1 TRINITY_DN14552_c0_g1~~TRINITY_DN14552_c0_g1_i6.p1  ORF type:complete len:211 (-),score=40.07 TRINITY_DN14552_c0_g1_i6:778-1410(-)